MLTPAQHYARASELLALLPDATHLTSEQSAEVATAAAAHATLAAVPWAPALVELDGGTLLDPVAVEAVVETVRALAAWADSEPTTRNDLGPRYAEGYADGTRVARDTVRALLVHAHEAMPR